MTGLSVTEAAAWIGLDLDIGDRCAIPSTIRRQRIWAELTPSARILLWGWTGRQPEGWWSLVKHACGRSNVRYLTYRNAIQPLVDVRWAWSAPRNEIWLTRDGRNARAALQRALFLAAQRRKHRP